MTKYAYQAIRNGGGRQKGQIEAASRQRAIDLLHEQGALVVDLKEVRDSIWTRDLNLGTKKVQPQEFVAFCRQFATLIRAGVTMGDALRIMAEQVDGKILRLSLLDVTQQVQQGAQLSDSMEAHKNVFPPIFTHMIRAGEISGSLENVLDQLAIYMEKQYYTIGKIKSALTYPISVAIFAVLVTIFLLVKVIPTFVSIFAQQKISLPLPTRLVLNVSHVFIQDWYLITAAGIIFIFLIMYFMKSKKGHFLFDRWKLKIPIFGQLFLKGSIARMSRTLSTLFASAVPTLQAFTIAANVVGNDFIAQIMRDSRDALRSGGSMVDPLKTTNVFPPLVVQMIAIGEQTGSIDEMFAKIADFYEADVDHLVDRLKPMIEPLMIVFLAVVVGTIVLAAILPMFSLYQHFGQMAQS